MTLTFDEEIGGCFAEDRPASVSKHPGHPDQKIHGRRKKGAGPLSVHEARAKIAELLPGTTASLADRTRQADGTITSTERKMQDITGLEYLTDDERGGLVDGVQAARDRYGESLDSVLSVEITKEAISSMVERDDGGVGVSKSAGMTSPMNRRRGDLSGEDRGTRVWISATEMGRHTDEGFSTLDQAKDSAERTKITVTHELAHAAHFDMLAHGYAKANDDDVRQGWRVLGTDALSDRPNPDRLATVSMLSGTHGYPGIPGHGILSGALPSRYASTNYMEAFAELETATMLGLPRGGRNPAYSTWRREVNKAHQGDTVVWLEDGHLAILDHFGRDFAE